MMERTPIVAVVVVLAAPFMLPVCRGNDAIAPAEQRSTTAPDAPSWGSLLSDLVREMVPREYEKRDGWGAQSEIVSGVRVRDKNGLPRISKRTKRVNHGVWRRYRIALHRPEEKLRIAVRDVQPDAGEAGAGGLTFKVVLSARVRCTAETELWSYGVRTGSASVQADATVAAVARFAVRERVLNPDDDGWLVDLEYALEADRVRIDVVDLDVRRIGKLDGDLADGLGNTAQALLAQVLKGQEGKVTRRIQRALDEGDARFEMTVPRVLIGKSP